MHGDDQVWYGARVLTSKAALTLLCFWILLGALLLIPGPLRDRLRSASDDLSAPTGATPGLPSPAPAPPTQQKTLPAGAERLKLPVGEIALQRFEDPGGSMAHFYRALARTQAAREAGSLPRRAGRARENQAARRAGSPGRGRTRANAVTRVLHYGDSLIDLDFITAPVRRALQKRFGDGGHGFVLAARPWRWYNHMGISMAESSGWDHFRLVGGRARDGHLGLGCAAVETHTRSWIRVTAAESARASRIEVHYLRMPGGGKLRVRVDGKRHGETIDTAAENKQPGFKSLEVADGAHSVRVDARGAVRLFGLVLERDGPGITWENLPLISARFNQFVRLDQLHWARQLQHRRPDLVLFQFGANDTISYGGDIERYGKQVLRALKLVRKALPRGSCLVIGPLDRLQRNSKGELRSPRVVRIVSDRQREVALAAGCAFWDGQKAMGGRGSMRRWLKQGLVLKDFVHLNVKGSDVLGSVLEQAVLAGYDRFRSGQPRSGGAGGRSRHESSGAGRRSEQR